MKEPIPEAGSEGLESPNEFVIASRFPGSSIAKLLAGSLVTRGTLDADRQRDISTLVKKASGKAYGVTAKSTVSYSTATSLSTSCREGLSESRFHLYC